ncbi:group II trans-sialidase superfamily [Trypanosoma rangeli]|uniref:Group II trans-sialidase superfamily n=1 Tax=Trypanosoma rangeli TaxID=5698 RepID=A0A422MTU3_TRYRA|nr:group II trans-sialidase superfamily [Trypanosoma rangeli]RNE96658.1 group II trans-sialidase superfamily [Trypanosoma rangeli]|eukprot:RNE96658.1 group II trans-sialidase superfamily [Trypanosoma rangeli]
MLKMCRHLFSSAVLLLFVLLICCGSPAVHAEGNAPAAAQVPKTVDLFVPNRTIVERGGGRRTRDSFASPSLASAGGVLIAFAEGHIDHTNSLQQRSDWLTFADIVAGYIKSAESWSSLVAEVNASTWEAHGVLDRTNIVDHVGIASLPTTIAKDNKVFLLVGSYDWIKKPEGHWEAGKWDLELVVGEARQPKETQDKVIQWGQRISLLSQIEPSATRRGVKDFIGAGGSGVVMKDGRLVFPLVARRGEDFVSMIIYSADDGNSWTLPQGMPPAGCTGLFIVEWEQGQLLMIAQCLHARKVFESRDMGATWTEAVRTLTRVQANFLSAPSQLDQRVTSLTTATIAGKKVMLYTQKGITPEEKVRATALYLWVTDNNRTFHLGPISMDATERWTSGNALLHSKNALYLLQEGGSPKARSVALASLTGELKTITSVLETWASVDSFLSNSSVPTVGLVGFLSGASSEGTWDDAYRCVGATVTNATKVENGFKFTGSESHAMWPVNMWYNDKLYGFVDYEFTLVATVTIHKAPNGSASLLGAGLEDNEETKFVGLSYTREKQWGTVFNGITTTRNSTWEPGKEYKVALMLQGNEGSVYVDGVLVGITNKLPTLEARRYQISHFYFGGSESSSVTVKNVFLYNRPLNGVKKVDDSDASRERAGGSSTHEDGPAPETWHNAGSPAVLSTDGDAAHNKPTGDFPGLTGAQAAAEKGLSLNGGGGDSAGYHGGVSRGMLLAVLGLCGAAAVF